MHAAHFRLTAFFFFFYNLYCIILSISYLILHKTTMMYTPVLLYSVMLSRDYSNLSFLIPI